MAKMSTTSTIKIMLDGQQAESEVHKLRKQFKSVGDELAIVQEKFRGERAWDPGDTAEKLSKRIKELKKLQRSLRSAIDAHVTQIDGVDEVLARSSEAAYNELTKKRTSLLNLLKRLRLDTDEELKIYQEKSKALAEINKEISERDIDIKGATTVSRSQEVLAKPEDFSTKEINDAVTAMTKFRDSKQADSEEWKHWNGYVQNGKKFLEEFNQKVKTTDMEALHADLQNAKPTISDKDLNMLVKYWEEMAQGAKSGSAAQADFNKKLEEARALQTARKQEQAGKVVGEVVDQDLLGGSIAEMQNRLKLLQDYRNTIDSTKPDAYVRVDAAIEKLTQGIKESQAGFLSFDDAMKKAADLDHFDGTVEDLEKIQKVLKEGMAKELNLSDPDDMDRLKQTTALLDGIVQKQKELADINKREQAEAAVSKVGANIAGSSPAEIEEAIRLAKDLQKMNGTSADQYKDLAKFISEAEAQLKTWNDQVKHAAMENQFLRLATLSKNALEEQQKYWQSVFDNAEKGTAKYLQAERKLADINRTMTDRKSAEAGAIMGNLKDSSVADIERAIKMTEELMKAHARGSQEYEIYAEEIKKAEEYLQSYVDVEKQVDMEDKWSRLRTLSTDALAEQKKYWQEMVNGTQQGTQELKDYQDRLKAVVEEERMRLDNQATKVLANPTDYSVKEVQDAVKAYEQIRDAQRLGSGEWEYYNKKIEDTRATLKKYNDEAKVTAMESRLGGLTTASTASLAEQKKFWQEMVSGAEQGTQALKDYQENLDKVLAEEKTRIQNAAQKTITDYNTGNWNKTIGETKEAIKQLQEYRNTLNQKTDATALADVDKVLSELTQKTKEAEQGFISLETALTKVYDLDNFDGSIQELEKLKKRLEEIRDTEIKLNAPDAKGQLIQIGSALDDVNKKIDEVNRGSFNLESTLKNLDKASMKDLNRAAEELKKQINDASISSAKFVEASKDLRAVNKRLEEAKELWKEKENIITKTAKRLASYVLVYAGFNEIVGKLKEVAQANLELSDSLADIQKTTGLSAESVAHLSDQINEIDTRSAQKELHDLAYEAGKLGISAEGDVLAFVRAGNQLLVALGEDLGGAEAVRQLMKVNAVLGETQKLGVEKALLATGSAINEISQTSRASAGPIADMVKRIGAIGAASNLTMSNLVALAGTADAMGQSAEVAGTAFNKFLGTLQTSSTDVAYSLGLDPDRLKQLLSDEETAIYGIIEIFEKMNLMGDMADLSPIMKDLGSEGARMTQVLTTMAGGVEELKAQVFTSKQAFEEATSVTNEYNIKNESAAAILERMGNNLREMFTNSTIVSAMKSFLQWLYYLPNALERNRGLLFAIRVILYQIAAVSLTKLIAMIGSGMTGALAKATKAWKMFNLEAANFILLGGDRHGMWQRNTLRALAFAGGINKVRIAFAALGRVIAANPIFFIGTAIAAVSAAIHTLTENTNKAAKAQAEFDASVRKEQFELDNLRIRIEKANSANGERASLIQQLNNKYGQYLGFMVTEANYLKNQEYIYKLLNAQIERSLALKMQEKLVTDISEKYADQQLSAYEDMDAALSNAIGIGEGGARDAMSKLMNTIKDQAQKGVNDVNAVFASIVGAESKSAIEELSRQYNEGLIDLAKYNEEVAKIGRSELGVTAYNELWNAVKDMLKVENNIAEEAATASELSQSNIESLNKKVLKIKQEEAEKVLKDIESVSDVKGLQEAQSKLNDYVRQRQQDVSGLIAKQQELNSLSYNEISELEELNKKKANNVKLTDEEVKRYELLQQKQAGTVKLTGEEGKKLEAVNAELDKYQKGLDVIKGKLAAAGDFSLWGEGKTIKDADVNQLVAMYKKLESDGAKLRKGATESIQTSFWKGFKDREKAAQAYYEEARKIKEELESRGYNTSGHFKWGGAGSGSEGEKQARKELNAVMAALEEHFLKRKAIIQQAYLDEKISGAEMNRQIADNDEEFRRARIELRKELVGEANTFNQSLYPELKGKDIQQTAKSLQQIGDVVTDGIRKNIQKDEVEIRDGAIKLRQAFEDELLKRDLFGKFENEFRNSLDNLELLSSEFERKTAKVMANRFGLSEKSAGLSEENQKKRLQALINLSEKSYQINEQGMVDELAKNKEFAIWVQNLDAEQRTVLLQNLRDYYDQRLMLQKQYTERLGKEMEAWYEQSGQQKDYEATKTKIEKRSSENEILSGFGVEKDYGAEEKNITDEFVNEYNRLDKLREKAMEHRNTLVEGSQEYIATNALITQYEMEQNALLAQGQRDLTQVYMEEWQKRAERWGEWGEMFGDYLGEQVMLEKQANDARVRGDEEAAKEIEARQKKNKEELIKTALTKVVDLAAVWAKEFALKMMYNSLMEASDQQRTVSEVTNQGKATTLSILLDALKGQAHEHGKGLSGLVTGAIIFAATMALQAMAKSAIANMFPEAASETNKATTGRLATGMLTYAEGNYPVLGNDGNVYNAKYEGSEIKTGIYRGGAHFGIFSEKKPEAIIDGDTTQRLIMNHPDIWKAIVTLSKTGRLDGGMRTFASGNINDLARQAQDIEATATADSSTQMVQMQATIENNNRIMAQLTQVLAGGITARMDMYGENGAFKQLKKAEKFANRVGYK